MEQLPEEFEAFQVGSISSPHAGEDFATPDLVILPSAWHDSNEWLAPSAEVEFVAEVISQSNPSNDTINKVEWYAKALVPLYLLIDPRDGSWKLYSRPIDGSYRASFTGRFKEAIELPAPLNLSLATDDFKVYGTTT